MCSRTHTSRTSWFAARRFPSSRLMSGGDGICSTSCSARPSVVVSIERLVKHSTYGRYVRQRAKFKVHDEKNECRIGDVIRFMETRPLSKDKRWRFVEFVERAK